jgi:hypothetical protein
MKRRKPLRSNPERKARVRGDEVYGSYHWWIKNWPCLFFDRGECSGSISGHHVKSVGSGGRDARNEVPLCAYHHRLGDDIGWKSFQKRMKTDLKIAAEWYWRLYNSKGLDGSDISY